MLLLQLLLHPLLLQLLLLQLLRHTFTLLSMQLLAQHQQALCYLLGFRQTFMLLSTQLLLLFLLQLTRHLVLVTLHLTLTWRTIR